nr:hypothetical protein [Tanacetum cinerariifolium]
MNDPNITMEEYIRLEDEKAQKRGKVFEWETSKYGKIWYDEDVHNLKSVETEFPDIVFNDNLSSNETLYCEPANLYVPSGISFDPKWYYKDGDYTRMLRRPRYEGLQYTDAHIVNFEMRLARIYKREVHRVQVFDFEGLPNLMVEGLRCRMLMEHRDAQGQRMDVDSVNVPYLLARYLRLFASGRNQGDMMSEEIPIIDMAELGRLQLCMELDDTWAWVALGPERQSDAAAGAPEAAKPARTMAQRLARVEEDVHETHRALGEQKEILDILSIRRIHAHDTAYSTDWPVFRYFLQDLAAKKSTKLVKYQSSEILYEEDLQDNHEMKESHIKEVEVTKMVKVKENALDVEIQIISLENVQSRQEAIIKKLSLEEHGVIVAKMKKKRLKMKLIL